MKYCKKCGMLLEDNMELCIGCGSDVKSKGTYSKYPEEIELQLEQEKKEATKRNLAILAIVLVFVVILLMIGIFVSQVYENGLSMNPDLNGDGNGFFAQRLMDSINKGNEQPAGVPAREKRDVKDDAGSYYKYAVITDDAGNEVFHAVYPEDFEKIDAKFDYERGSQKYPEIFSFIATNDDKTTQLTYMSPQHYQYITLKSSEWTVKDIEDNLSDCVSFYDFTDVESYLKEMIKQGYPTSKKIEELGSTEVSSEISEKLDKIVEAYDAGSEKELPGLFGLPETTSFKKNKTIKSAKIYDYRILTKEDHAVNCRFYVPVFCEVFDYKDSDSDISGQALDCYILSLASFEAGSDELYDWYEEAFDLFINNIDLNEEFYKVNDQYAADIRQSLSEKKAPAYLPSDKASDTYKKSRGASSLSKAIADFTSAGPTLSKKFSNINYSFRAGDNITQMYIDPGKGLVYVTEDATDYPGDDFIELSGDKNEGN